MLKLSNNAEQIFELLRRINKERNLLQDELNKLKNSSSSGKKMKFHAEMENMRDEIDGYKDELQKTRSTLQKLQKENDVLSRYFFFLSFECFIAKILIVTNLESEMRSSKHFQDEVDAAHENSIKVDRLEQQISRYQDKLEQFNLYKAQVEELQKTNIELTEMRDTAAEEANKYKSSLKMKSHKVLDLEKTVRQIEQDIDVATAEKDEYCEKYHELSMEHCKLIGTLNYFFFISFSFLIEKWKE